MKFILGKKIEMSQLFAENGNVIPVTIIQAGPCLVTQVKREDGQDKYNSIQIGFGKKKSLSKAVKGHLKDLENYKWLREFRAEDQVKRGDKITADTFEVGDIVKVTGNSKGKGFQGVVKRHGFHGSPASHGHKDQLRMPGSIGATGPARVFPGQKMPGHMGDAQISVKNLEIVKIDTDKNLIYIKGAIPGARGGLVKIVADGEVKVNIKKEIKKEESEKGEIEGKEDKKLENKEIPIGKTKAVENGVGEKCPVDLSNGRDLSDKKEEDSVPRSPEVSSPREEKKETKSEDKKEEK